MFGKVHPFRPTISTFKEAIAAKETNIMAFYMIEAAYTAEAWATMTKNPQDRSKPFRELAQKLGGRLIDVYFCFGKYDIVALFEASSDNVALATSMAAVTPGHVKTIKTTRLFTVEETMEAMHKAGSVGYQGPSRG
jgi:uncharacterized protein with GYD domain